MEPQGKEIYVARMKAALARLGIEATHAADGSVYACIFIAGQDTLVVPIDISATAPEFIPNEVLKQVFMAGKKAGYDSYRKKLKELVG